MDVFKFSFCLILLICTWHCRVNGAKSRRNNGGSRVVIIGEVVDNFTDVLNGTAETDPQPVYQPQQQHASKKRSQKQRSGGTSDDQEQQTKKVINIDADDIGGDHIEAKFLEDHLSPLLPSKKEMIKITKIIKADDFKPLTMQGFRPKAQAKPKGIRIYGHPCM